jgi:hypothetical protein
MMEEFQMSMMGELTFFLGIQVNQTKQGIFVHQGKYMKDLMKKFNMAELKPVSTLRSTATTLDPNENSIAVDQREYMSLISSLIPHGDTVGHSVHRVLVCMLSVFLTLFTSDNSSMNLQVSQIHTQIWDLVFCFFFI